MAVWVLLAVFALVDWQVGDRLYVSYVAYDHAVRTILVDAAARTGVPQEPILRSLAAPPCFVITTTGMCCARFPCTWPESLRGRA